MTQEELAAELERIAEERAETALDMKGDFGRGLMQGSQSGHLAAANLIRTTPIETEGGKKMREALGDWIQAIDDLREFERENPNNSTKVWDNLFYAVEAAEQAAREALGGQQ